MSELLALSFDSDASPAITLKAALGRGDADLPYGWGFGWYPGDEPAAVAIKDPTSTGDDAMTHVLRDWERFRASIFVCHLRGAAKRITQRDAQPFIKSHAGRSWLFAHSGDLAGDWQHTFPLPPGGPWEPIGRTDSEHLFCWMLAEAHRLGARSIEELGPERVREWLARANELGTLNALLSDGTDLVVYQDARGATGIHWVRRTPPHETPRLESDALVLELSHPRDPHRTVTVFSTHPLSGEAWQPVAPGGLVVARRSEIVWSSEPSPGRSPTRTPAAGAGIPARSAPAPGTRPELSERTLQVFHETVYAYSEPVERSLHRFRLRPVHDLRQEILDFELTTSADGLRRSFEDVFGNRATSLEVNKPFRELVVRVRSRVRIQREDPLHLRSPLRRDTIPLVWMPWQRQMMLPYLLPPELPESELQELTDFAMSFVERNGYDLYETLLDMNALIYRDFEYVSGSTTLATTPFEIYATRRGVCQDFANLLICLARLLNVPARYRVGYIYTGGNYRNRIQSDASHAWAELYLPWVGWHGLDPTNGCEVSLDHVRVACGRNYVDATPTAGVLFRGGGTETLTLTVRVEEAQPG